MDTGIAHILAYTDHRQIAIDQLFIHFNPGPTFACCLIDDIAVAVMFVEIPALNDFDAHGTQVVPIDGHTSERNTLVAFCSAPTHISGRTAQRES